MALTKQQMMSEKDAVVSDLFGKVTDIKEAIASMSDVDKEKLAIKVKDHIDFYTKIANEEFTKPKKSFRIETAKLRSEKIYPQLLNLIQS